MSKFGVKDFWNPGFLWVRQPEIKIQDFRAWLEAQKYGHRFADVIPNYEHAITSR